jgi:hypothetical protein
MPDHNDNLLAAIHESKTDGSLLFSAYNTRRRRERGITTQHIKDALNSPRAEVLEHYPDDSRPWIGHSPTCLVLGWDGDEEPLHVEVAYVTKWILTTYRPEEPKWRNPKERADRPE